MAYSPECPKIPPKTTPNPAKYYSFPVYQDPSRKNWRDVPEDCLERFESMTSNMYKSVNDPLAAAQQQVNESYTYTPQPH